MELEFIVWNCQGSNGGAKWDVLWDSFMQAPVIAEKDVLGYLVESGVAPWITGDYKIENIYSCSQEFVYYDEQAASKSAFCKAINPRQRVHRSAYWVGWVKNINAKKVNGRCSLAAAMAPSHNGGMTAQINSLKLDSKIFIRPTIRTIINKGKNPLITVFLVHFISGYEAKARECLQKLIASIGAQIAEGSACIIFGDMNINIKGKNTTTLGLPNDWYLVRTNVATQQSGGELDFAVLYDPNRQFQGITATVLAQYKTGVNQSDHSAIAYSISI